MRGTLDNLGALGLPNALTGPIARGDAGTVARHLQALAALDPDIAELYRELARFTLPIAEQTGNLDIDIVEQLRKLIGGD